MESIGQGYISGHINEAILQAGWSAWFRGSMNFGNKLKLARAEARLSQAELGRLVGLDQPRISDIENGIGELYVSQAMRIARALKVDLGYLADDAKTEPARPLGEPERYAVDLVRVKGLTKDEVIERLTHDPRARPDIVVPGTPKRKNRRA